MKTPCISMWQPWAQAVEYEFKTIETRTHERFRGLVGKRIGIHLAQKWDKGAPEVMPLFLSPEQWLRLLRSRQQGGVVRTTAKVSAFEPLSEKHEKRALIECRSVKRFGLFLTDVQWLHVEDEVRVPGKQGIFYVEIPSL